VFRASCAVSAPPRREPPLVLVRLSARVRPPGRSPARVRVPPVFRASCAVSVPPRRVRPSVLAPPLVPTPPAAVRLSFPVSRVASLSTRREPAWRRNLPRFHLPRSLPGPESAAAPVCAPHLRKCPEVEQRLTARMPSASQGRYLPESVVGVSLSIS